MTAKSALCLVLAALVLAGSPAGPKMSPGLERLVAQGHAHYQKQEYELARNAYEQASQRAGREGNLKWALRLRNNIGATFLAGLQHQGALQAFLQAREMARQQKDGEVEAAACANLAAIYMMIGDGDAAEESLAVATARLPVGSANRARLLAQRARLEIRRGAGVRAEATVGEALAAAQSADDRAVESLIWDDLAMMRMGAGDLSGAETALANEYRLWALFHTPNPEFLHWRVARLRLFQGRAEEALEWLKRAASHGRRTPGSMTPHWREYDLAVALEMAGRRAEALEAARRAWKWSVEWRQEVLPAQTAQLAADVAQADLAALYARLADGSSRHQEEVFLAVEQSRAASLRYALLNRPAMRQRLGAEYTRTLMGWRGATARWLNGGEGGAEPATIGRLRARLAELEASAGLPAPLLGREGSPGVEQLSGRLGDGAVLFSFQLGEPASYARLLTSKGVMQARLPGRAGLTRQVEEFRKAIEANDEAAPVLGWRLYQVLFGFAPQVAREAPLWYLSLDDALLSLPFSALRTGGREGGAWLAESHRIAVAPSAFSLLQEARPMPGGRLLAVGDAVHNSADPRYRPAGGAIQRWAPLSFWIWPQMGKAVAEARLELPALAGSGREIEKVAAVWRKAGVTAEALSGADASVAQLEEALSRTPGTVHFATHVIPVPHGETRFLLRQSPSGHGSRISYVVSRPDDAFLALSMRPDGGRDGVNTATVPAFDVPGSLIVLNGCSSGLARTQTGAGLMGFARAWISAGASSVVASLWPLTDDSGAFFESFYSARLSGHSTSKSLQTAQTAMIRGQGWRAEPRHWAAYVAAGQE
jgi:CHAT domain-containing protein